MAKEKRELREKIVSLVMKHRYGLSIDEVAGMVGVSRITASKYLAVLEALGRISARVIGNTRLHYMPEDYRGKEHG